MPEQSAASEPVQQGAAHESFHPHHVWPQVHRTELKLPGLIRRNPSNPNGKVSVRSMVRSPDLVSRDTFHLPNL